MSTLAILYAMGEGETPLKTITPSDTYTNDLTGNTIIVLVTQ